jgi:hypothetical protein
VIKVLTQRDLRENWGCLLGYLGAAKEGGSSVNHRLGLTMGEGVTRVTQLHVVQRWGLWCAFLRDGVHQLQIG